MLQPAYSFLSDQIYRTYMYLQAIYMYTAQEVNTNITDIKQRSAASIKKITIKRHRTRKAKQIPRMFTNWACKHHEAKWDLNYGRTPTPPPPSIYLIHF